MNVRGPVVEVGETRTVSGGTELAEVTVRPERGAAAPTQVTLWRKWAESADYLEPGMELLVTDIETDEWQGETQYATTHEVGVVAYWVSPCHSSVSTSVTSSSIPGSR